jgi:peptidylprolyl isomerase
MNVIKWFGFCLCTLSVEAEEKGSRKEEIAKISEAMGHLIGKNLHALGLPLDIEALVRGMQEASIGKESPLTEEECMNALSHLQEESLNIVAEMNLNDANAFLTENQKKEGIVALESGKLQYQVMKNGNGQSVESYSKPLIRYSGKCLNGPSIPMTEEFVDLDETILGFQKALVGMKEGEVRTLYIHPEFGYGEQPHPTPNALLIFEVELIKADGSIEAHAASNESCAIETELKSF